MTVKVWCDVVMEYKHAGETLYPGERKFMERDTAEFLAANGVVSISGAPVLSVVPREVNLQPDNGSIGTRSIM
jgi:hypothetical protein